LPIGIVTGEDGVATALRKRGLKVNAID